MNNDVLIFFINHRSLAFDNDHDLSWPEQAFQPFSESRAHCSGNMSYDISRLTCSLCPVNSIPNSNGKQLKFCPFTNKQKQNSGNIQHQRYIFKLFSQELVASVQQDGESFKMLDTIEEVVEELMAIHQIATGIVDLNAR